MTTPRELGDEAGNACLEKAEKIQPTFTERATEAVLNILRLNGPMSGERISSLVCDLGIKPHDERAFGPVFASLSRKGLIRTTAFCMREKGHGTAGGRVWALS